MNKKHAAMAQAWMDENPEAYELFDRFAQQMATTRRKFGAKLVAERIRWECRLRRDGEFKWNNNYTTYVAHKWAEHNPHLADLLEFRTRRRIPEEEPVQGMLF